jgi:flagellar biosynthetic protein FliR
MEGGFPLPAMEMGSLTGWLTQFLFAMMRIGAFLIAAPVFGGRFTPLPIRIMATVILTIPVFAHVPMPSPDALAGISALRLIIPELALGLTAGLVLNILFGAASLAGDRIASTAGLSFAAQVDPAMGGQTPVVAQIFSIFLLSTFFALDGHLVAIRIVIESYTALPPGGDFQPERLIATGLQAGTAMFALGLGIMLPVVSVLLLLNIVIGVITRSAPALNLFSFGFPLTMAATLLLLWLTVPGAAAAMQDVMATALDLISPILGGGV